MAVCICRFKIQIEFLPYAARMLRLESGRRSSGCRLPDVKGAHMANEPDPVVNKEEPRGPLERFRLDFGVKGRAVFAWLILGAFLALVFWKAIEVVFILFAGILTGVIFGFLADWLAEKFKMRRSFGLAIVVVLFVGAIVGFIVLLAPQIAQQVDELAETLPRTIDQLQEQLNQYGWGQWIVRQIPSGDEMALEGDTITRVLGIFSSVISAVTFFILIIVLGVYIAAEEHSYKEGILYLFPRSKRDRMREVLEALGYAMRWWMLGQGVSMTFLAIFAYIGLTLLGIPLALLLALLTGILTFIPTLGPAISLIPPLLLALAEGDPMLAVWVSVFYIGLQNLEGYLITPMVQRKAISLPPGVLLSAEILLLVTLGFLGLLFAAPLTAVAIVLVKMLYVEDVLGEDMNIPGIHSKTRAKGIQARRPAA
jgi:predicted PurR-regulated permease PerM